MPSTSILQTSLEQNSTTTQIQIMSQTSLEQTSTSNQTRDKWNFGCAHTAPKSYSILLFGFIVRSLRYFTTSTLV